MSTDTQPDEQPAQGTALYGDDRVFGSPRPNNHLLELQVKVRQLTDLVHRQQEQLTELQRANEARYAADYDATGGPAFHRGHHFPQSFDSPPRPHLLPPRPGA